MKNTFELAAGNTRKHFQGIAEQWNGDEPEGEDRAVIAGEITEKCAELETLLEEYKNVWLALNRITDEELKQYRKSDWIQKQKYLNQKFGDPRPNLLLN